ncbi:redox-sensitive transcriptional activator SoxR [Rhodophyticola sp. CCM32]|uniref:redox-sensitive transcriptional activator SoxR n=1 Tax=Rhodophyticola sp. CCM32 TaxID=2916397 RepID=UPI00107EF3A2|nr:redox-sensitive transcriptional activator SoxR [Rhodophyticola sp. CCM32]QBX99986.1 redox-sensitive transcriptional activator SoxR [Rhodophyticola sp. CCM32]
MSAVAKDLSVGEMAARAGVAISTLHYYEAEGLIRSWRNGANHRRYDRKELRRVAIIRSAQSVGVPLAEIKTVLDALPPNKVIKAEDWARAAESWAVRLDAQIERLQRLRKQMTSCIGCGCLSLTSCPLYNADDSLAANGAGPRRWIGGAGERAMVET